MYPASAPPLVIRGQNVAGYVALPCWSGDKLQTIQFIPPVPGDKLSLTGASFGDGCFTVGEITDRVYICEGIGQAWAASKATGAAAVVCFGAGRMATVAKVLHEKHPAASLVIVPDKGKEEQAAKIAADVSGQMVTMPADKPSNYDCNDLLQEQGASVLAALLERHQSFVMRYKLLTGADLCNAPPMRWMVRGVLPVEGLAAVYGASGSGKSFLILDMGCAVAGGADEWFGRRVTQAPVTYVCLEDEAGAGKRVQAWSLHHGKPLPDALRFITQPFDLLSDDVGDLARAVIAGGGAGGVLILDTLNRAAPGADENSSVDMGNLIAAAKQLQSLIGGLVLLVHHTGKDSTKGLRGHSSLYAALDGAVEVIKTGTRWAWSVAKCKDDVTGDAHPFKLEIVPVGNDVEGEAITSCVIVPDESTQAIQKKIPTLGSNQGIAHKALGEPLRMSQNIGKGGAPEGRPCITFDDALIVVAELMPVEAKHQKQRAKEAIAGLVRKGIMGMKGEWLWDN
ncbi:MAG: AAA family ATPase [Candidatus Nitrotoga sp.]